MVEIPDFKPEHMNVTHEDLRGNNGIGRYVFFPGSDGRAKKIAEEHFKDLKVKEHPRAHNLYTGYLEAGGLKIDVASISSGMGTPSLDIIFNELNINNPDYHWWHIICPVQIPRYSITPQ